MSSAAAQYKKKDGTLSVSADGKTVSWEAVGGVLPPLAIAIADIGSKFAASYKERSKLIAVLQISSKRPPPPRKPLSRS